MAPADARRSSGSIASERRIFSLVLALVASPQGLTKRELLSTVHGYAERYRHGETDATLERQFERDKDHLRELGIPLETLESPFAPGDNRQSRYRISKGRLQTPDSVRFTAKEIALLRLASLAWAEGTLTAESRRSAMKIEALGAGLDVQHLGIAPRLGSTEPAGPALRRAIEERRTVRFEYRMPGRTAPLERHVAPLRLHRAEGRWHLLAYDLERAGDRVFLLSRVTGAVRIEAGQYDPALSERVESTVDELLQLQRDRRAEVRAQAGSVAEARLSVRGDVLEQGEGFSRIEIGTLDYHELAEELAGYGEQVVVAEPPGLRDEVAALLLSVLAQHDGAADPPAGKGAHDAA
jgi:proteasome accessory factor B